MEEVVSPTHKRVILLLSRSRSLFQKSNRSPIANNFVLSTTTIEVITSDELTSEQQRDRLHLERDYC